MRLIIPGSTLIADAIIKSSISPAIPLKGIAIGNGWIDPREQYQGYVDFAYEKGLIKEGTNVSITSPLSPDVRDKFIDTNA